MNKRATHPSSSSSIIKATRTAEDKEDVSANRICGRRRRWRHVLLGTAIVFGLFVSLVSESRVLLETIDTTAAENEENQQQRQSPTPLVSSSSVLLAQQQEQEQEQEQDDNDDEVILLLDVSLPPLHAQKLYKDTQHSHTSPLSPNFKGRYDSSQYYNLQSYMGCKPTERVQLTMNNNKRSSKWMMQTFEKDTTKPKTIGGDEFYVTFTLYSDVNRRITKDPVTQQIIQHPTLVAIPTDLKNGTYELEFFYPPTIVPEWTMEEDNNNGGYLTIYLTHTCGMGLVTQKSNWKSRGSLDWVHIQHNVTTNMSPILGAAQEFQPPTMPPHNKRKLSDYKYVAAFGDSVLGLFVGQYRDNKKFIRYPMLRERFPSSQQLHFKGNIRRPFVNNTVELQNLFRKWHNKHLQQHIHKNNTAILLGSGTWDLGKITWTGGDEFFSLQPILDSYREFWQWLIDNYPNVDIYWKSLSAMHPHNLIDLTAIKPDNLERVRKGTMYVSATRAKDLDLALKQLIHEQFHEQITILDVYHATALTAEWLFPADSHHYKWEMNRYMLMEWFY